MLVLCSKAADQEDSWKLTTLSEEQGALREEVCKYSLSWVESVSAFGMRSDIEFKKEWERVYGLEIAFSDENL